LFGFQNEGHAFVEVNPALAEGAVRLGEPKREFKRITIRVRVARTWDSQQICKFAKEELCVCPFRGLGILPAFDKGLRVGHEPLAIGRAPFSQCENRDLKTVAFQVVCWQQSHLSAEWSHDWERRIHSPGQDHAARCAGSIRAATEVAVPSEGGERDF